MHEEHDEESDENFEDNIVDEDDVGGIDFIKELAELRGWDEKGIFDAVGRAKEVLVNRISEEESSGGCSHKVEIDGYGNRMCVYCGEMLGESSRLEFEDMIYSSFDKTPVDKKKSSKKKSSKKKM